MNNTKRYYNWLVNNGYLEIVPRELSETEKKIVIRREKSMSFAAIGGELGMSVPNVIQRYNNAKAKGYVESYKE
jgi:DNA-binding Lrp family transcriptional regulator